MEVRWRPTQHTSKLFVGVNLGEVQWVTMGDKVVHLYIATTVPSCLTDPGQDFLKFNLWSRMEGVGPDKRT